MTRKITFHRTPPIHHDLYWEAVREAHEHFTINNKTMSITKKAIYETLLEDTELVSMYMGGAAETEVIALKNSEGWDMPSFIETLADKIVAKIEAETDAAESVTQEEHEKIMEDFRNNR